MSNDEMRDALEAIVDKIGLASTLANLAEIASLKAQHIRENWQDEGLAKTWDKDSRAIDLNNDGSRWIDSNPREMQFVLVLPNGTRKVRKADWYESFGNFAATAYRYRGKRFRGLAKAHDGSEMRDPQAKGTQALPHIFHED